MEHPLGISRQVYPLLKLMRVPEATCKYILPIPFHPHTIQSASDAISTDIYYRLAWIPV